VILGLAVAGSFGAALAKNARGLVNGFLEREGRAFHFVVFLVDRADRSFVEERLLVTPGVLAARFVTKEEALGRAQDNPALAEGLKLAARNPLPESFEVSWIPAFLRPDLIGPAAEKWGALDGVSRVGYDRSRLERMALLSRLGDQLDVVLSSLLWAASAAAIFWTAQLLFWSSGPMRWGPPLVGLGVGAIGGGVGAGVLFAWMGAWEPAGVLAGVLVGFLAGLGRCVERR
jgi:cell division protein FtsX